MDYIEIQWKSSYVMKTIWILSKSLILHMDINDLSLNIKQKLSNTNQRLLLYNKNKFI